MKSIKEAKNSIIKIGQRLDLKGLTYGTSGNISVKVDEGILITASGTALADLCEDDIVLMDWHAQESEHSKKASSEKCLHTKIYELRPDLKAIIHCHAPTVSAYAVARIDLDKACMAENVLYFGKIPVADYAMPSSSELVQNTASKFEDYDVVLMANHGIIAGDADLRHAFYKIDTAEAYAKVCLYSKILGKEVLLSDNDVMDLENLKKSMKS